MSDFELSPLWQYRIDKELAYLCRGTFHRQHTGGWLGYAHSIERAKIEVKMTGCDNCDSTAFWVDAEQLEQAGGIICCEHCGAVCVPSV